MITQVTEVLANLATQALEFVLLLIPATIVFLIGKFVAKKLSKAACWAYKKANGAVGCNKGNCGGGQCLDKVCPITGKSCECDKLCRIIAGAVYWVLYILTLVAVFDILGVQILSDVLSQIILVIPTFIQYSAIFAAAAVSWVKKEELAGLVDTVVKTLLSKE